VLPSEGAGVEVAGVGFVGLRTDQFSQMVRLLRDVIGMPLAREAVGLAGFRLDDDTVLEIIGPGTPPPSGPPSLAPDRGTRSDSSAPD
jgi:hypothetical protein